MHTPNFIVDEGVRCIPVNDLVRSEYPAGGYVVLGAGKTAMDACTWLLDNGVDNDEIVVGQAPRLVGTRPGRMATTRQGRELHHGIGRITSRPQRRQRRSPTCSIASRSAATYFASISSIEPTMYRARDPERHTRSDSCAASSNVVRAGHVRRIQTDRIVLDAARFRAARESAVRRLHGRRTAPAVDSPDLRGEAGHHSTSTRVEPDVQRRAARVISKQPSKTSTSRTRLAPPNTYPELALDWIRARHVGMIAQRQVESDT